MSFQRLVGSFLFSAEEINFFLKSEFKELNKIQRNKKTLHLKKSWLGTILDLVIWKVYLRKSHRIKHQEAKR